MVDDSSWDETTSQILGLASYLACLTALLRATGTLPPQALDAARDLAISALPDKAGDKARQVIQLVANNSEKLAASFQFENQH